MSDCKMLAGPPGLWLKMKLRELLSEKSLTLAWPDGFPGRPN